MEEACLFNGQYSIVGPPFDDCGVCGQQRTNMNLVCIARFSMSNKAIVVVLLIVAITSKVKAKGKYDPAASVSTDSMLSCHQVYAANKRRVNMATVMSRVASVCAIRAGRARTAPFSVR